MPRKTAKRSGIAGRFSTENAALLAALAAAALLSSGCGSSYPATAPVSGKVTLEGEPVIKGTIMFYPEDGRPAMGDIQPDGTYQLRTFAEADGALPGKHQVTIKSTEVVGGHQPESFEEEVAMGTEAGGQPTTAGELKWLVPPEYARQETSPLEAEVTLGKENEFNFDLKREP